MPNHRQANRDALGSHARNAAREMQLEVRNLSQQAQDRAYELRDAARDRACGLQSNIEEKITSNPIKSILIATGVGVLFGYLWRR